MVATMLIIISALLVLGLAQIARREARESTDTLLSTQAFYAAETGVNDARAKLATMDPTAITPKNSCPSTVAPYDFNTVLDSNHNVAYTCLLIDPAPPTLTAALGTDAQVLPIQLSGSPVPAVGTINVDWSVPDGASASTSGCPNSGQVSASSNLVFSPPSSWSCHYGVLRLDIAQTGASDYSRSDLINNTMTLFVVPSSDGSGSVAFNPTTKAGVVAASGCSTKCQVSITGLTSTRYYVRATEIYKTGGNLNVSAAGAHFVGAQAVVDVTGKAQDVLRRIRVALDISGTNPNSAATGAIISGDSVCKRFQVTADGQFNIPDAISGGGNPLCN